MKYKTLFIIIFLSFLPALLVGQWKEITNFPTSINTEPIEALKNNINHNNGKINISIPILKEEEYNLNLNYTSNPFFPTDTPHYLGYNWSLNFGGVITREVNYIPDDFETSHLKPYMKVSGYLNGIRFINNKTEDQLLSGNFETEPNTIDNPFVYDSKKNINYEVRPDKYYFNFQGIYGYFYINHKGEPIIIANTENLKIDLTKYSSQFPLLGKPIFSEFKITDNKGNQYFFGGKVDNLDLYYKILSKIESEKDIHLSFFNSCTIIGWHLYKIIYNNGKEIEIEYESNSEKLPKMLKKFPLTMDSDINFFHNDHNSFKVGFTKGINCNGTNSDGGTAHNYGVAYSEYLTSDLNKFKYYLKYSAPRLIKTQTASITFSYTKQNSIILLNKISISDINNRSNKNYNFIYWKKSNSGKNYILLSKLSQGEEEYKFDYNIYDDLPNSYNAVDQWGFWNGKNEYGESNDYTKVDALLLKKIVYPSGGYTEYHYEPSDFSMKIENINSQGKLISLKEEIGKIRYPRVRKIVYGNIDGKNITKEFKYILNYKKDNLQSQKSSGIISLYFKSNESFLENSIEKISLGGIRNCSILYVYDNILLKKNSLLNLSPVNFSEVQEFENNVLKKVYEYTDLTTLNDFPLTHKYKITTPIITHYEKFTHSIDIIFDEKSTNTIKEKTIILPDISNRIGNIKSVSFYDARNKLLRKLIYNYNIPSSYLQKNNYVIDIRKFYYTNFSKIIMTPYNLTSVEDQEYLGENKFIKNIIYEYDEIYNSRLSFIESTEKSYIKTSYQYAHEKGNNYLIDKNVVGVPLETIVTQDGKIISKTETIYPTSQAEANIKTQGLPLPVSSLSYDLENPSKTNQNITYTQYDNKGNLIEYKLNGIIPVVIIWGYHQTLPIAKIEGATYDQVKNLVSDIISKSNEDKDEVSEKNLIMALDNFRNKEELKNFQITTYTHNPLIGVTSITPPSGIREIYKYDDANRLKQVLDIHGNILKEYRYNYRQP